MDLTRPGTGPRPGPPIRRNGVGTLATHCIAAGLPIREARIVAGTLRKNAAKAGATGTPGISYAKNIKAHDCTRYTPQMATPP